MMWRDTAGKTLLIEGEHSLARQLPGWLRLDKVPDRDFPVDHSVA
jgi:hypothetical protein